MIDSVMGGSMPIAAHQRMSQSLSNEQKSLVKDTLAEYDLENLSQEDAQAIIEVFDQAGIQPGRELEAAMADAGIDAKDVGELGGVQGPKGNRPPPPPRQDGMDEEDETDSLAVSSIVNYLEELLENRDISELTDADKQEIYSQLVERRGLTDGESLIKLTV